jgi:hypothetical protein
MGYRGGLAVTDHGRLRGRVESGDNTVIRSHVGGCARIHDPLCISREMQVVQCAQDGRVDVLLMSMMCLMSMKRLVLIVDGDGGR